MAFPIFSALKTVLGEKRYLTFGAAMALLTGWLLYQATRIPGQSLESWMYATPLHVKFLVAFGGVMLGLIAAVQAFAWFEFRHVKKRHTVTSLGALGSTLVAVACCSPLLLPLAGLLGFGGAIFFFQTHQLPIVAASAGLLLVALHYSSKAVDCEECRVKVGMEKKP